MKTVFLVMALAVSSLAFSQKSSNEASLKTISRIFEAYIHQNENIDSQENKDAMQAALKSLEKVTDKKNLTLLIDVWMYYDPTDFPTRRLVEPVLYKDRPASIAAIEERLKNKKKWEKETTAPYSDLVHFKKAIVAP